MIFRVASRLSGMVLMFTLLKIDSMCYLLSCLERLGVGYLGTLEQVALKVLGRHRRHTASVNLTTSAVACNIYLCIGQLLLYLGTLMGANGNAVGFCYQLYVGIIGHNLIKSGAYCKASDSLGERDFQPCLGKRHGRNAWSVCKGGRKVALNLIAYHEQGLGKLICLKRYLFGIGANGYHSRTLNQLCVASCLVYVGESAKGYHSTNRQVGLSRVKRKAACNHYRGLGAARTAASIAFCFAFHCSL
nr:MAG TPA: hypothetical protein [Bacteriophage sp.]